MDILKYHISTGFFFILLSIFVPNGMNVIDAACTLPEDLQSSTWEYNYTDVSNTQQSKSLAISTTTLRDSVISLDGRGTTLDDWTCINGLTISSTEGVVVFKSDSTYSDGPSNNYRLYLCMKFTKVTPDLYYFYLLSDIYEDVTPKERTFGTKDSPSNDAPICSTFCQYTGTPPKIRTLRKPGTMDSLPSSTPLCACGSSCKSKAYSIDFNKTWTIVYVAVGLVFNFHIR
ncbi:uncharacterized protein LOC134695978 [Mytilus trossulus]|uniref:uncharacterized protein LOC134695978 n=1 Tax=Mytilus trossulus TaxID=6551 RepID=UPI003004754F